MAASPELQAVGGHGPFVGFANMVDKEYGSWWRTRRALVHVVLWLFVINGFILLVGADEGAGGNAFEFIEELIELFFRAGGLFATIGIVVTTQSALLGERQMGTAEWVLSKPVTRDAFLFSKLLVNGLSFFFLAAVIPSVLFFLETLLIIYLEPNLVPFLAGLVIHGQHLLFYLAFTLALGSFLNSRSAISGTAIGFLFAGLILPNFFPSTLEWLPWALPIAAVTVANGDPLPSQAWLSIGVTVLWTALCILLALWRFDREEF